MHNALLIAVLAGLGGMVGWGSADFFAKKTVDKVGPITSLVWGHSFGTSLFVLLALGQVLLLGRSFAQPSGTAWLGLAGFGALQMVVYWLLYIGFEKGKLAILNPIFASFTGIVALVSIVGFGEHASTAIIISLLAIFAGIILLNLDLDAPELKKKVNLAPGVREVAIATLLAAGWTLGWDKFINGHDSLSYALWMYAFMTLTAFLIARLMKTNIGVLGAGVWKYVAMIGAGEALAYLAVSWGYSATSSTSIVALISGAFSVPTVILAYIFLKERLSRLHWAAIAITIAGIIGVSIG